MTLWYLVPFPVPLRRGVKASFNAYLRDWASDEGGGVWLCNAIMKGNWWPRERPQFETQNLNPMVGKELGTGYPQERVSGGRYWELGRGHTECHQQLFPLAGGSVGGLVSSWLGTLGEQAEGEIGGRALHLLSQNQFPHTVCPSEGPL